MGSGLFCLGIYPVDIRLGCIHIIQDQEKPVETDHMVPKRVDRSIKYFVLD